MKKSLRWFSVTLAAFSMLFLGLYWFASSMHATEPLEVAPSSYLTDDAPSEPTKTQVAKPASDVFDKKIMPFLNEYCTNCHNSDDQEAGIVLDVYLSEAHAKKDRKTWEMIQKEIASGAMPPKRKKNQPSKEDRAFVADWIANTLTNVDCTSPKNPGRVTIRRLNRVEYNNTIRDLTGVSITPADDFPSDDVGYGFDHIGDVLSVQPILIEKYLNAADRILNLALPSLEPIKSTKQTYRPQNINVTPRSAKNRDGRPKITFTTEGSAYLEKFNFPASAEYVIRSRSWGISANNIKPKLSVRINDREVGVLEVEGTEGRTKSVELKFKADFSENNKVELLFINPGQDDAKKQTRTVGIETLEIEGPFGTERELLPATVQQVLKVIPTNKDQEQSAAKESISDFARRSYRRPVTDAEVNRLMSLYQMARDNGDDFLPAIKLPLKAIMVSPNFLFRVEADPKAPEETRRVNDFEFITRLSYFLWSTMPDEELFDLATQGRIRDPKILAAQVERMLNDPKSEALVKNFAGQWLMLRNLQTLSPDPKTFPKWDETLRASMIRETELFFEYILQNNRPVTEFLDADYTFLNARLARHYGVNNFEGRDFRKVSLPDTRRGGLVTQASILTVTSNPTRTSPVKRGKWVLENILGTPPPPPAPDVPELEAVPLVGTLRQQMEQHRANPACATCHAKLDPLGFGLENFDGIGEWRTLDNKEKIDSSGILPDGSQFDGPAELRKVLLQKADQFRRALSDKMLTYALGRGLEYFDKCILDDLVRQLKDGDDRFRVLILSIVQSDPFQKRSAKRSE